MLKWLLLAALAVPAMAQADPLKLQNLTANRAAGAPAQPAASYAPQQPTDAATTHAAGSGLRATIQGRSMDLDSPRDGWASDPAAGPKDILAGYDWRGGNVDAVVGYGQFEGPRVDNRFDGRRRRGGADGVLGFSFVLHGR